MHCFYSCSHTIECPREDNCDSCVINCDTSNGGNGCFGVALIGHSCSKMTINCNSTSGDVAETSFIYAPDSFGNLTINTVAGDDCFKSSFVYVPRNGGFVTLNCNKVPREDNENNNDEWYGLEIVYIFVFLIYIKTILNCTTY